MARDTKLTHLGNVRLFSALSSRELTKIGRAAEEITVPAGKEIVEEGRPGHEFFLILDGRATIDEIGAQVFEHIRAVAGGEKQAKAELHKHREFQVWSERAIAL